MAIGYVIGAVTDKILKFDLCNLTASKSYKVRITCKILNDPLSPSIPPTCSDILPITTTEPVKPTRTLTLTQGIVSDTQFIVNYDAGADTPTNISSNIYLQDGVTYAEVNHTNSSPGCKGNITVTNATAGVTYVVKIKAMWGDNTSAESSITITTTKPVVRDCTLFYKEIADTSVTLGWILNDIDQIKSVHLYFEKWQDSTGTTGMETRDTPLPVDLLTATEYKISNLTNSVEYAAKLYVLYNDGTHTGNGIPIHLAYSGGTTPVDPVDPTPTTPKDFYWSSKGATSSKLRQMLVAIGKDTSSFSASINGDYIVGSYYVTYMIYYDTNENRYTVMAGRCDEDDAVDAKTGFPDMPSTANNLAQSQMLAFYTVADSNHPWDYYTSSRTKDFTIDCGNKTITVDGVQYRVGVKWHEEIQLNDQPTGTEVNPFPWIAATGHKYWWEMGTKFI